MAAVAPTADQASDLLQKLSLDPKNKTGDTTEVTKKNTVAQFGSANGAPNGADAANSVPPREMSVTPLLQECMDARMCYVQPNGYPSTYYYGGYDGSKYEWEEYPRYVNPEGVEISPQGVYGDVYHPGYGYAPYGPYPSPASPVPTLGHDGHLYGPQPYQYPAMYYQPPNPNSAPFTPNQIPSSVADQPTVAIDASKPTLNGVTKGNANMNNGSAKYNKSNQHNSVNSNVSVSRGALPGGFLSSTYQDPEYGYDAMWSPYAWVDAPMLTDWQQRSSTANTVSSTASHLNSISSGRNQNLHHLPHAMGAHATRPTSGIGTAGQGITSRMYPSNRLYDHNGSGYRSGLGFGSSGIDSRINSRWGIGSDGKYKPRGRGNNGYFGYGNENMDGLTELNRGPRAGRFRNLKGFESAVTIAVKGQSIPTVGSTQDSTVVPNKDQYNPPDFPETYSDAKFFIIKSYSEDDIHKSIKYNVWASTPNGNKKLDAAYHVAKEKTGGCPVFLLFSVNTSGQFVGVAEMVGAVDFNKNVEYWQQDKWTGCFSVKWHLVKDVPNSIFKHIILENNDNKPVTNSRDTQEVKLDQGLQILKIFKDHVNKTSILDDFSFYENRQKAMQDKRLKQQLQKKAVDAKPVDINEKNKDGPNQKPKLPLEVTVLKDSLQSVPGERVSSAENGVVAVAAIP